MTTGWGTDKPTVEGWYWWRFLATKDGEWIMQPIKVIQLPNGSFYSSQLGDMTTKTFGEFLGPITPDAYAAGRRAGRKEVCDALRQQASGYDEEATAILDQGDLSGPSTEFYYVAKTLREIAREIEAQAQGGE